MSVDGCDDFVTIDPYGHIPIGVNQPQGGTFYPFLDDENGDSPHLAIADLSLQFVDNACEFVLPFRVQWLYGFGCYDVATPTTMPHAHDMLIVDANDTTVFDTTAVDVEYRERQWTSHQKILEWRTATAVLLVTHATAWRDEADVVPLPNYLEPTDAVLDSRTLLQTPPQLTKLRVGDATVSSTYVNLVAGNNVVLTPTTVSAIRRKTALRIDVLPGRGTGRYPAGCDSVGPPAVRKIGGVGPDASQNFNLTVEQGGCYTVERTVYDEIAAESETRARRVQVANGLMLAGNCEPCCDCPDYRAVYESLRQLVDKYRGVWDRLQIVRDTYEANRDRWLAQLACRESSSRLQIVAAAYCPCQVGITVGYCNQRETDIEGEQPRGGDECLRDVVIHVSFEYDDAEGCGADVTSDPLTGQLVANSGFRGGFYSPGYVRGIDRETYTLHGTYPHYWALLPSVPARGQGYVTFSVEFPDCVGGRKVRFIADAYAVPGTSDLLTDGSPVPGYVIGSGPSAESLQYRLVKCPSKKVIVLQDASCIDLRVKRDPTTTQPDSSSGTTNPNSSSGTTSPSLGTTTLPVTTTTVATTTGTQDCECYTAAVPAFAVTLSAAPAGLCSGELTTNYAAASIKLSDTAPPCNPSGGAILSDNASTLGIALSPGSNVGYVTVSRVCCYPAPVDDEKCNYSGSATYNFDGTQLTFASETSSSPWAAIEWPATIPITDNPNCTTTVGTTTGSLGPCDCDTDALPDPASYMIGDRITVPCVRPATTTGSGGGGGGGGGGGSTTTSGDACHCACNCLYVTTTAHTITFANGDSCPADTTAGIGTGTYCKSPPPASQTYYSGCIAGYCGSISCGETTQTLLVPFSYSNAASWCPQYILLHEMTRTGSNCEGTYTYAGRTYLPQTGSGSYFTVTGVPDVTVSCSMAMRETPAGMQLPPEMILGLPPGYSL